MPGLAAILALSIPTIVRENAWAIGAFAFVCLVGLGLLGFRDVVRLSIIRIWAISDVCFRQAIRRRVLWMTPLVILGVIVVSQLARPVDAQDDIRQTTKFCLFATGLLVTLVSIILACTNLPKEIESRVIYTVATKPATRLEIIVGKVVGFSRVSGAILILMGVFSLAYLHVKQWRLREAIGRDLADPAIAIHDPAARQTQEYYHSQGLLHARAFHAPGRADAGADPTQGLQIYASPPTAGNDQWSVGGGEQFMLMAMPNFMATMPPERRVPLNRENLGFKVRAKVAHRTSGVRAAGGPATSPATAEPRVSLSILGANEMALGTDIVKPAAEKALIRPGEVDVVEFDVDAKVFEFGPGAGEVIYFMVTGLTPGEDYRVSDVKVWAPQSDSRDLLSAFPRVLFRGRPGTHGGQQLRGESEGPGPVAIYRFEGAPIGDDPTGDATFEVRVGIEVSGDRDFSTDQPTSVDLTFYNTESPNLLATTSVPVEDNRVAYARVPAKVLAGGKFLAAVRCRTTGNWLMLRTGPNASLRLVKQNQPFEFNLLKSLLVLWLMSILVIIVSVFCSTFVSWPIAVMLTLVILMAHWLVAQVGDFGDKGMGRAIVADVFGRGMKPAETKALEQTIGTLTSALPVVSGFLPDISTYEAIERLETGTAIPLSVLLNSLTVTLGFGIPLMVASYVFLKYKEVAP